MKKIIAIVVAAASLASCSSPSSNNTASLDACGCAKLVATNTQDQDSKKKCEESIAKDQVFALDYQKCLMAAESGTDTSKVSIGQLDAANGLNFPAASDGQYNFNASSAKLAWMGKKVTGQHMGTFNLKDGFVAFSQGNISGGQFNFDMNSILVTDLSGDAKADLEGHLKSDDFFATAKNPSSSFIIKSSKPINKHQFEVTGDLVVKGISKPATMVVLAVPSGDKNLNVSGALNIDRTQYDIKFRSAKFFSDLGDKMIDDNFLVKFDLQGSK